MVFSFPDSLIPHSFLTQPGSGDYLKFNNQAKTERKSNKSKARTTKN